MKRNILIVVLLLLSVKNHSQDPQLFVHDWYLHKVIVESVEYIPPSNEEVLSISAIYYDFSSYFEMETSVCNVLGLGISFNEENEFIIDYSEITLIICEIQENAVFEGIYFGIFFDENNNHYETPFTYIITTEGSGNKSLVVKNSVGDEAHYGSVPLSQPEFSQPQLTLHPNPVKDVLHIHSTDIISRVSVYDIRGKMVKEIDVNSQNVEIDVSHLPGGLYFIKTKGIDNSTHIKRVIKK